MKFHLLTLAMDVGSVIDFDLSLTMPVLYDDE